jgi:hypothetical protein
MLKFNPESERSRRLGSSDEKLFSWGEAQSQISVVAAVCFDDDEVCGRDGLIALSSV